MKGAFHISPCESTNMTNKIVAVLLPTTFNQWHATNLSDVDSLHLSWRHHLLYRVTAK